MSIEDGRMSRNESQWVERESFRGKEQPVQRSRGHVETENSLLLEPTQGQSAGDKGEKEEAGGNHGAMWENSQQGGQNSLMTAALLFQDLARESQPGCMGRKGWERKPPPGSVCFKYILSII